jgi:nitrate/nitrite transporter NarK
MMMTTTKIEYLVFYWTLCLISFDFVYASVFSAPLKYFHTSMVGSVTGFMNFGGQLAGSVAPVVMGSLILTFGGSYQAAFWFLVASAFVAFMVSLTWKTPATIGTDSGEQASTAASDAGLSAKEVNWTH